MSVRRNHTALRSSIVTLLVVISLSQVFAHDIPMQIEFLGMKNGCPNSPKMWLALQDAITQLHWDVSIDSLDVNELAQEEDLRAGYGSPTILVNGEDLFGAPFPQTFSPACRYYRGGVPGTGEIVKRLKAFKSNLSR